MTWQNQSDGAGWDDQSGWQAWNWWNKAAWEQQSWDAIAELRSAGNAVDQLSPEQLEVARSLSPAEVAVLNSVKWRIDWAGGEVEGHSWNGLGLF
jgi:hypothetical protein